MKRDVIDPRILLFDRYFGDRADKALRALDPNTRQTQYLKDLFDLNIDDKLGKDFNFEKRSMLHAIRLQLSDSLNSPQIQDDNHDFYLEQLNKIINNALNKFSEILSDEEYLLFFSASKDEVFDIRILQ
jgi:hypothetical protein